MSDLVKRNIAIRELVRSSVYKWSVEEDQLAHNWAISIIESLPSSDAVEVVRCKDCVYGSEDYPKDIFPEATGETYSCVHSTYSHDKDFYCKYGERR